MYCLFYKIYIIFKILLQIMLKNSRRIIMEWMKPYAREVSHMGFFQSAIEMERVLKEKQKENKKEYE